MSIDFVVFLIIVISIFVFCAIWGAVQKSHNDAQTQISVRAQIIAIDKRYSGEFIRGRALYINLSSRVYYITFELLPAGDRKKLVVPVEGHEQLAEGDIGTLTLQGTRYISFKYELHRD